MNEHVKYGLDLYVADTDPQCAILIKGDWGCGKTHFIKEWIKEQDKDKEGVCQAVYISLFGISTIQGLLNAINKAISPILYNAKKYGKEFLKLTANAVLRYEMPVASSQDNFKLKYEISPLDLLSHINISKANKEYKVFVFDDVERCDIPLKELFGCIDYLFEHVGSRVVLVLGKTEMQGEEWNKTMRKYQEKIVGREYEIYPDIDAAVSSFVEELQVDHPKSYEFLQSQRDSIRVIWEVSTYNNLRSLRQCIRSFAEVLEPLEPGADEMKQRLFANYLAYCLEYYNGDKTLLQDLSIHQIAFIYSHDDTPATKLVNKYHAAVWQKLGYRLFDIEFLDEIKESVTDGKDIADMLNRKINAVVEQSLSEKLRQITYLENHDVDALIREAKAYLNKPVESVADYLFVTYKLCYWEEKKVCVLKKSFEKDCLKRVMAWIRQNMRPTQLASTEMQIKRGLRIQDREHLIPRFTWLEKEVTKALEEMKNAVKEPVLNLLEKISNDNIEEVLVQLFQVDIYNHANYSSQSIFNRINIRLFCQGIRRLSNRNKMRFVDALEARYGQNFSTHDYKQLFGDEGNAIAEIREMLERYREHSTKMDRVAYDLLIEPLDHALGRLQTPDGE